MILGQKGTAFGGLDGETIAALERIEMPICLALAEFEVNASPLLLRVVSRGSRGME